MDLLQNFYSILPIVSISILSIILLLFNAFFSKNVCGSFLISIYGIGLTFIFALNQQTDVFLFSDMIRVSYVSKFLLLILLSAAFLSLLISKNYLEKFSINLGEYYTLLIFSLLGAMLIVLANDFVILFLGIELMSLGFYVLSGFNRKNLFSNEASLKYFLLGAFATGFLLYGIALVYGATGTTKISEIISKLDSLNFVFLFVIGIALIMIGVGFKIAASPFHMWVPDVYEGSPSSVTIFMASVGKVAGFAALILTIGNLISNFASSEKIKNVIVFFSIASMVVGNLIAISQKSVKRMLAYSSIAHAGYILTAFTLSDSFAMNGILFYLFIYVFMTVGSFGIISLLEKNSDVNFISIENFKGLSKTNPMIAMLMSIFLFSLTGVPPFAGFLGKYYVLSSAVKAEYTFLVVIGVLTSVIAAFYYLRIVVMMYFQESDEKIQIENSNSSLFAISISAIAIIVFGIFPSVVTSFFR